MWGRFTQNYTWEEVYAFLNVLSSSRSPHPSDSRFVTSVRARTRSHNSHLSASSVTLEA